RSMKIKKKDRYHDKVRSQVMLLIAIALVILLQLFRQIYIYQTIHKQTKAVLPPFVWHSTGTCWVSQGFDLLKVEGCEQIEEGSVIRVIGTPSTESDWWNVSKKSMINASFEVIQPGVSSVLYWQSLLYLKTIGLRAWLMEPVRQTVSYPEEPLVESFVLGGSVLLPEDIKHSIKVMGISHIIAVSGFHITLLLGILSAVVKINKRTINTSILLFFLVLYATLVGWQPSVTRSLLMSTILLLGKTVLHRQVSLTRSLLASAVIMVALDPLVVLSIGWQLSVFATVGVAWIYPSISRLFFPQDKRRRLSSTVFSPGWTLQLKSFAGQVLRRSLEAILVSCSVILCILPVIVGTFGSWSWGTLLSSFFLWWLFPLVISSCFIGVITVRALSLLNIYPPLLQITSSILLEWPVRAVTSIFGSIESFDFLMFSIDGWTISGFLLWYLCLFGVVMLLRWRAESKHGVAKVRLQPFKYETKSRIGREGRNIVLLSG
ncbi:ComEC/Rec2 family competence protein, partial [Candidatus Gracilibacteria bacterium]|nr:ComEC/Rec2 family competence protein [Candidatus Gracilibacteria bacterium]